MVSLRSPKTASGSCWPGCLEAGSADSAARKALLLRAASPLGCGGGCDIKGSSEQNIRNVVPADINRILRAAEIQTVIANGDTAYQL